MQRLPRGAIRVLSMRQRFGAASVHGSGCFSILFIPHSAFRIPHFFGIRNPKSAIKRSAAVLQSAAYRCVLGYASMRHAT
jgi:hypothetical protein